MSRLPALQHWLAYLGLRKQWVQLDMKDGRRLAGYVRGKHYRTLCQRVKQLQPGAVEDLREEQS